MNENTEQAPIPTAPWSPELPWLGKSDTLLTLQRKGSTAGVGVWLVSETTVAAYLNALEARVAELQEALDEALAALARADGR